MPHFTYTSFPFESIPSTKISAEWDACVQIPAGRGVVHHGSNAQPSVFSLSYQLVSCHVIVIDVREPTLSVSCQLNESPNFFRAKYLFYEYHFSFSHFMHMDRVSEYVGGNHHM
jgi:hypothetical protein